MINNVYSLNCWFKKEKTHKADCLLTLNYGTLSLRLKADEKCNETFKLIKENDQIFSEHILILSDVPIDIPDVYIQHVQL